MKYLISLLKFETSSQIVVDYNPAAKEDILIGLGYDWAAQNSLPK